MDRHIQAGGMRHHVAAILIIALIVINASLASAQTYYCLPTCSQTDARFLSLSGSAFRSIAGDQIAISLAAGNTTDSITFDIFDGETSGVWDGGTAPLVYSLYADASGDGTGTRLVGKWYGNAMSDSAWYHIAARHDTNARAESGVYYYMLKIRMQWGDTADANNVEDDPEDQAALLTRSNFKIRSTANMSTTQFAFCAPLFSTREAAITYPNYPLLTSPTYDGTWSLYIQLRSPVTSFELWDGDMDFGAWDGAAMDTDDTNTTSGTTPSWSGTNARTEGVAESEDFVRSSPGVLTGTLGTGSPMDDNMSATYRRSPSVYYDVLDPNGNTYHNGNPSGNLEWERFVIARPTSSSMDTTVNYLPRGVYEVRITGMDMHNVNAWRYSEGILGVTSTGAAAPMPYADCPTSVRSFAIGATSYSSAEISEAGELYTWGDNCSGQLGDGTGISRSAPVKVLKGDYPGTTYLGDGCVGVKQAAIAHEAVVVVMHDGSVYAWGENLSYLLGVNSASTSLTAPKRVVKGAYPGTSYLGDAWDNPIEKVAAGTTHLLAVSAKGLVYAWGKNERGQCGDGTTTDRTEPVRVAKGAYNGTTYLGDNPANPIIDIAAGEKISYALAADGTVYAWGFNGSSQLGDGTSTLRSSPVRVLKGAYGGTTYLGDVSTNPITSIMAMQAGCMALTYNGQLYTWGDNTVGQLGDNSTTNRSTPVRVLKGACPGVTYLGDSVAHKVVSMAAGGTQALALTASGRVYAWGGNALGQVGDNSTTNRLTPVRVVKGAYTGTTYLGDASEAITCIGGGIDHSLALSGATNKSYAWGGGAEGQLGHSATTNSQTPVLVSQGARPIANDEGNPDDGIKPSSPSSDDDAVSIDGLAVSSDAAQISVTLTAKEDIELDMNIYSADGVLLAHPFQSKAIASGVQRVAVALPSEIPSGLYFVSVKTDKGSVARQFLLTR